VVLEGAGAVFTVSEWVVVVVVVGAGFSTTVVQEARSTVTTASSGVRIISFFIGLKLFLQGRIGADSSTRCISGQHFSDCDSAPGLTESFKRTQRSVSIVETSS
jgi:hypothetical protein